LYFSLESFYLLLLAQSITLLCSSNGCIDYVTEGHGISSKKLNKKGFVFLTIFDFDITFAVMIKKSLNKTSQPDYETWSMLNEIKQKAVITGC